MISFLGLGRSKKTVGLDVGSAMVKMAVVDHSSDPPRLERVGMRPLVADAIVDGEIMDPGLAADTISAMFEEEDIEEERVVLSAGGRDVIVKPIQMDRMSEEDAEDVIRWEAGQHVPFDIEEVELDFEITDPEGEGLQMNVLLVAAKRDLVKDRISLIREAGLRPEVVDVEAFGLFNAFEASYPGALEGVVGLVNVGHDSTVIVLIREGVPILVRDLSFGTRRLQEQLQSQLGMSSEQADALLSGFEAEDAETRELLESEAEAVAQGVERATVFLETREYGQGLGQLYLCGGGARVPGLLSGVAERVEVETRIANPLQGLDAKPGAFEYVDIEDTSPLFMLAVGLGLRKLN